jgi:hypothetical protein
VGGDDDKGTGTGSFAQAENIALGIRLHSRHPAVFQHLSKSARPGRFLEGWRRDFIDGDDFADDAFVVGVDKLLRRFNCGIRQNSVDSLGGILREGWPNKAGEKNHGENFHNP